MKYDVALSFAGEDRKYVEAVATELKNLGVRVFYDNFETVDLWGKDLYTHLQNVYQKEAKYTVIFISEHYAKKLWTNHERKVAQARAFTESSEYILPARFDDTEIEGILPTIGFIDLRQFNPNEFAKIISSKIKASLNFEINFSQGNVSENFEFSVAEKSQPEVLKSDKRIDLPQTRAKSGFVTFNYSDHNGHYKIGRDDYVFETVWSKASNERIYCMNDAPSVSGVALAPKGSKISDIKDASALNYTSRIRSPEIGRIVVFERSTGLYAAVKILDIKDDTRGDENDEITFYFWILTDGSKDFSNQKEPENQILNENVDFVETFASVLNQTESQDLRIAERQAGNVIVLDLYGKITIGSGSVTLRNSVRRLLSENKKYILLNLGSVGYVDSSGIGELVSSFTATDKEGGELKILNLTQKIEDLLAITKLLTVFDSFNDETEAIKSFN